jgi:FlaA1/EpsC-like NDP-sugar epimerase
VGVWYAAATAASFVVAMLLRYDFAIPAHKVPVLWRALAIALPVKVSIFYLTGLHRRVWWRFADIVDLYRVFLANVLASLGFAVIDLVIYLDLIRRGIPHSVYGVDFLVSLMLLGGIPLAYRTYWEIRHASRSRTAGKGILIYGAGVAGTMLVREIRAKPQLGYKVIGFLDDDPKKRDVVLMVVMSCASSTGPRERGRRSTSSSSRCLRSPPTSYRCGRFWPTVVRSGSRARLFRPSGSC